MSADRRNQTFERDEPDGSGHAAEMVDALGDCGVFHACAEPYIGKNIPLHPGQKLGHTFRALGEYLIGVPGRRAHYPPDFGDESVAYALVEEIAHRIDENLPWLLSALGDGEGWRSSRTMPFHIARLPLLRLSCSYLATPMASTRCAISMALQWVQPAETMVQPATGSRSHRSIQSAFQP